MNKVELMGRLTRDPEVRYSAGENSTAVARFTLAVDRRIRRDNNEQQTADYINCVAFGKTGETVEKYMKQGKPCVVIGRIQTGSYTNQEGRKVYTTEVVVEDLEFVPRDNTGSGAPADASAPAPAGAPAPAPAPADNKAAAAASMPQPEFQVDEDLPFN